MNLRMPRLPEFYLSEIYWQNLVYLSYVRYKQFDFSFLVNGKSIERKVFPSVILELRQYCFKLAPKVKGMFRFTWGGRGSNKLLFKEALPQGQNPINFTECFFFFYRKGFSFIHIHVASSLKPLSRA